MNLSCFATGFIGLEFKLDLRQTILIMLFGSLIGWVSPFFSIYESQKAAAVLVSHDLATGFLSFYV